MKEDLRDRESLDNVGVFFDAARVNRSIKLTRQGQAIADANWPWKGVSGMLELIERALRAANSSHTSPRNVRAFEFYGPLITNEKRKNRKLRIERLRKLRTVLGRIYKKRSFSGIDEDLLDQLEETFQGLFRAVGDRMRIPRNMQQGYADYAILEET